MRQTLTDDQKKKIIELREGNFGYKKIAKSLGVGREQVRDYSQKNALGGIRGHVHKKAKEEPEPYSKCRQCGVEITNKSRVARYCSKECYNEYKRSKRVLAIYERNCVYCKVHFKATDIRQKYCSDECRVNHRNNLTNICECCGKEYKTWGKESRFCSRKCKYSVNQKTHLQFMNELIKVHSGYIVPLEEYKGSNHTLKCMCIKCGRVTNKVARTYIGAKSNGCKSCSTNSRGEDAIEEWLIKNNIEYKGQYAFDDLRHIKKLYYDFAIFVGGELVMLIEYDGEQHFFPIDAFGGEQNYQVTVSRDKIKSEYAENNDIPLIRINYKQKDNISAILERQIKEYEVIPALPLN